MVTTTVEPNASRATSDAAVAAPADRAGPWYRDRRRLAVIAAVAVVAIALVVYFIVASGQRKEEFAARSLGQARAAAESGNLPLASSELQKLIATYRGTDAAAEAVIALNQIRLINNQSELAAANLREFLAGSPDPKYRTPASGLLGAALENAKRWGEAGDAYSQAAQSADVDYLKVVYLTDAGRAYQAGGMPDKAIQAYRTVVERFGKAPNVAEAQVRLAELTDGKQGALPATTARD